MQILAGMKAEEAVDISTVIHGTTSLETTQDQTLIIPEQCSGFDAPLEIRVGMPWIWTLSLKNSGWHYWRTVINVLFHAQLCCVEYRPCCLDSHHWLCNTARYGSICAMVSTFIPLSLACFYTFSFALFSWLVISNETMRFSLPSPLLSHCTCYS